MVESVSFFSKVECIVGVGGLKPPSWSDHFGVLGYHRVKVIIDQKQVNGYVIEEKQGNVLEVALRVALLLVEVGTIAPALIFGYHKWRERRSLHKQLATVKADWLQQQKALTSQQNGKVAKQGALTENNAEGEPNKGVQAVNQEHKKRLSQEGQKDPESLLKVTNNHFAAGVLPYYLDDNKVAYILLSKEKSGSHPNTWCDFGGARDGNETAVKTAAREAWEESRDCLGNQKEIEKQIADKKPLGMLAPKGKYALYLLKVNQEQKDALDRTSFPKRVFNNVNRMEKSDIAWVKADDVFQAIMEKRHNDLRNVMVTLDKESLHLRPPFCRTLWHALKRNKSEQQTLRETIKTQVV